MGADQPSGADAGAGLQTNAVTERRPQTGPAYFKLQSNKEQLAAQHHLRVRPLRGRRGVRARVRHHEQPAAPRRHVRERGARAPRESAREREPRVAGQRLE